MIDFSNAVAVVKRVSAYTSLVALLLGFAGQATSEVPFADVSRLSTPAHVPGQLLIQYKSGFSEDFIEAKLVEKGATRVARYQALNMDLIALPGTVNLERYARELTAESMVAMAAPNYIYRTELRPNDTRYPFQWHLENTGANFIGGRGAGIAGADLNLVAAWDIESDGQGSIIAIIDDAVQTTHEDLSLNIVAGGRCFDSATGHCGGNPNNPNPTGADQDHGTLVAGTAAARSNNVTGVAGAAWQAGILPYKTDLTDAAITAAINAAVTAGAHIINMSFGGARPSQATRTALTSAGANGILAVASAGNGDSNNDRSKAHYPSNYDLPNLLAVASSDGYDDISGYSQWGPFTVELAAPGEQVQTTSVNDNYRNTSGTSFSSPLVAGVAALVRAHTGASGANAWKQIRAHLLYGGVDGLGLGSTGVPGRDRKAIPGRVQAGRLDAERALQGPPGGVVVINGFTVDDSSTGNANGLLDPGETADLVIELENVWSTETGVVGTLVPYDSVNLPSAFESGQLSADIPTQSFGTIAQDQKVSARFPVTLGDVADNEQYFLTLQLQADSGPLPDRYFGIEIGTLLNSRQITQTISRLNFDEFHAWHIEVPPGSSNLVITTTAENASGGTCRHVDGNDYPASVDIDLLVRFNETPEYAIALDPPEGGDSFFVDADTQVDGNCGGHETISIPDPRAGTYHIVVVNFEQIQHDYTIVASFAGPPEGSISFNKAGYEVNEVTGVVTLAATRSGGSGAVSIDYATRDGSASAGSDYTSANGTLNWANGESGSKSFQVSIATDGVIEQDETFLVNLSNPGGGAIIGSPGTTTVTIKDSDNPGELAFAASNYAVVENGLVATIGVRRNNGSKGVLSVNYATADGTATAAEDYQSASGTLVWLDGDTVTKFFDVTILEDAEFEAEETVNLTLSNPIPVVPVTLGSATLSIEDNDNPGSVRFDQTNVTVSETEGSATVSVSRIGANLFGGASIDYVTADDSATAGADYQATSGTLVWLPGEGGSKQIVVPVTDETVFENDESFFVNLENPSSGLIVEGASSAQVTIEDDDDPGALRFSTPTLSVSEGIGSVNVSVLRVAGIRGEVTINYATASGSAIAGSDFSATSGTLTWSNGDNTDRTIQVSILNDSVVDVGEFFNIELSSPGNGARLGSPSSMTITINDNDGGGGGGSSGGGGALGWLTILLLLTVQRCQRRVSI